MKVLQTKDVEGGADERIKETDKKRKGNGDLEEQPSEDRHM